MAWSVGMLLEIANIPSSSVAAVLEMTLITELIKEQSPNLVGNRWHYSLIVE